MRFHLLILATLAFELFTLVGGAQAQSTYVGPFCSPPAEFREDFGAYKSPLIFDDGRRVNSVAEWAGGRCVEAGERRGSVPAVIVFGIYRRELSYGRFAFERGGPEPDCDSRPFVRREVGDVRVVSL